ncbi:uncharacterized protein LOC141601299 [Silene latifolia]|uniref:uncharacterized protein LOC141601299 n=1 Tax=Silene latifolia TaxID=37657 RepID=UPI003D77A17F
MYETVSQTTYSNVSYYEVQPPPNPNFPATHFQSQPISDPYSSYGAYPPPNYATFQPQPSYYSDPNVIPPAIQPLQNEAIPSASYGTPMNTFSQFPKVSKRRVKKPKVIKKKKSVSQSVFCNLCKIECNSVQHYEKHISGKNHNKAIKKTYPTMVPSSGQSSQGNNASKTGTLGGEGGPGVSNVPANLEEKKQKLLDGGTTMQSLRLCNICNVACNGEIAFSDHLIGKKHIAKERALNIITNPSTVSVGNPVINHQKPAVTNPQKSAVTNPQKPAGVGPAWCDVCKISCTSSDGLTIHRNGKKHKKNLEILRNSISDVTIPTSSSKPLYSASNVSIPTSSAKPLHSASNVSIPTSSSKPLHSVAYVSIPPSSSKPLDPVSNVTIPPSSSEPLHPVPNVTIPASSSEPLGLLSILIPPVVQVDNLEPVVGPMPVSKRVKKKRARLLEPKDLESKKRKVLDCGADANAVRTCGVCNVVCNSETVFNAHIAGQKHILLVKQAEARVATSNQAVTGL